MSFTELPHNGRKHYMYILSFNVASWYRKISLILNTMILDFFKPTPTIATSLWLFLCIWFHRLGYIQIHLFRRNRRDVWKLSLRTCQSVVSRPRTLPPPPSFQSTSSGKHRSVLPGIMNKTSTRTLILSQTTGRPAWNQLCSVNHNYVVRDVYAEE